MSARPLSALLAAAGLEDARVSGPDVLVEDVCLDSRRARPGSRFLARPGSRTDGLLFVPAALAAGARAVLAGSPRAEPAGPGIAWVEVREPRRAAGRIAREWHGRPDESLTLVGITGTNGKTTVAFMVEAIAAAAGLHAGRIGTVGIAFGGSERAAERTTPESLDFFALLAEMRRAGVELVALEVSSHALALGRVEGARFPVAAFLNLGRDHLDFHAGPRDYFEAKVRLVEALRPEDVAVLPTDDPVGERAAARTRARVLTFGRAAEAHVRLRNERCTAEGSVASLDTPAGTLEIATPIPGRVNLLNAAAAAACTLAAGLAPDAIGRGLRGLARVPGRFERVGGDLPFSVFIDYAHTPDALRSLLSGVRELVPGRVTVVFGCGGERDRGKRPEMGRAAAEGADAVVLTSDNPRGEDAAAILDDIESGLTVVAGARGKTRRIADRRQAVRSAIAAARPGDAVVIAGKGHERTQTIGDAVLAMDDHDLVREAIAGCA